MTDTIQAPFSTDGEIKLFILYLLDAVEEPLDYVELHDIVVQNGLVKPFDFCLMFPEMIEAGMIVPVKEKDSGKEEKYVVTELGKTTLQTLSDTILHITKERALQHAKILLSMRKSNADCRCEVTELPNGKCNFRVIYRREHRDAVSLDVECDTVSDARRMQVNFDRRPDLMYRSLYAVLQNRPTPIDGAFLSTESEEEN